MGAEPKPDAPIARAEERIAAPDAPEAAQWRVGYCRPPIGARFRPGQSGNPRGRPKGMPNLGTVIAAALREKIAVTENDRERRITKLEVAVKQLVNRAAKGEDRATQLLFALIEADERRPARPSPDRIVEADKLVMGEIVRRIARQAQ